ncbi:hypothetical protein J6O48_03685 [bacterium]|nr:hypothetical protein [bacterium]
MNIKRIIIAILMVLFCATPSFAAYIDNFTRDADIKPALIMLEKAGAQEVFDNLEENSVKISFYDLSQISYRYMNSFALNSVDSFGNRYILINSKFKNASPEEIACLIAHESFHKLKVATLEEETLATQKEAHYWGLLKNSHRNYTQSPLLSRLNRLVLLDAQSDNQKNYIRERISNSSFYKEQLAIR